MPSCHYLYFININLFNIKFYHYSSMNQQLHLLPYSDISCNILTDFNKLLNQHDYIHENSLSEKIINFSIYEGDVLKIYDSWEQPDIIISDGAYGIRGFPGDANSVDELKSWYKPHIIKWSQLSKPSTSLWFWNTEIGWAMIHPLLDNLGWEYVQTVVWDKGIAHIAGNVNGKTIRQFPVVTEIAVLYRKKIKLQTGNNKKLDVKYWLHEEWKRSGLPFHAANEACEVKNAASRKYLTLDHLWYWPPGNAITKMAKYCTKYGKPTSWPYFSLDGKNYITEEDWNNLRPIWNHKNGITNVWHRAPLADAERIKGTFKRNGARTCTPTKYSSVHLNQKPLDLMITQIEATTKKAGVVWEPFGGLASASIAAILLGRKAYVAEINKDYFLIAQKRLKKVEKYILNNNI